MSTIELKNTSGAAAGEYKINDAWLEREKGEQALHEAVVAYLANQRQGNASTKTRAAVRGGGTKPWNQKGYGRARAGSIRSPIWVGGGVAFGPHPRSYAKKVNKKIKQLAFRHALAQRVDAGEIIVLDDLQLAQAKTKELRNILDTIGAGDNVLIIADDVSAELALSIRNIPKSEIENSENVNIYQFIVHRKVVITKSGFDKLGERLV
ncbi:MAG: 50S ribosomal protein L4 [Lentisphaeria bacterium]|nr:50S ribosomal protein L4 [Lentisphaeria bacterium]NQZ71181.1 50S ribosomal protein L4 [Lentisphaeria bacterium]